ncbi:MAG: S-layer homology domain-containing protein, partial [Desulfotomaculaceae bacterium]|nr:S-layer homology domain-containing protein [Desulfotomaculaceae bacterium]
EVTPVALTGTTQGTAVESGRVGAVVPAEAAPTAAVQPITGTLRVGATLTGHYTYSDVNGDLQGTSTFKWYRSDNAAGLNKTEIAGATSITYELQSADEGKYISFEVTPVALTGTTQGTAVESGRVGAVVPAEAAPTAAVQPITGTLQVGATLTGHYTYSDVNGDLEGTSTYKWYRADNAAGLNKAPIAGATSITYVLQSADTGKYISFEVTPVAASGTLQGTAVESASTGPVVLADITAASVTITAPVLGAAPQNAAAAEAATANPDYTVTGLVWNEALTADNKFKAGQVYTATVTLTSKNGKKFQDAAFTPTAAGSASVVTTTTAGGDVAGNTVSFTVTFAETGALIVSSIAVTTQPTKMSYTETTDAVLELNGMQVTETNNDGSTNVVTFTDGTAAGYTATPLNGTSLTNAAHNGNPVVITHTASTQTANTDNLTVNVNATAPVITNDLSTAQVEYSQNEAATALDATATVTDGGTISYAWYSNTTNSTVGATALGVTIATYTPSTAAAGTTYYYCVVTNTNNAVNGTTTAQTTSAISNIKVNAAGGGGSSHSSTVSNTPVITVSEVKSEIFSNAEDIKVEADVSSAFGQSVAVKITDDTESQKEIFSLTGDNDKVYPFDISLYSKKNNERVQPKDGYSVKITLPVPKELLDDREKIKVVYGKNGSLETLKSELAEKDRKWYITFEAFHFSPYALIVSAEPANPWANPFSDVKEGDWYHSAVQYAAQNGLMKGTGSNTFSPELVTSRGMIATILYNLDGSGETEQSSFKDVKPGAYYANAVAWAQKKSIIAGYGNEMFGPDDSITREQLAAMLWKYAGQPAAADSKGLVSFKDAVEISAYAQNALAWANQEGIINGKGGSLLDPKGKATRAEAAQIMQNFLQK